jgi:hypothetical protein
MAADCGYADTPQGRKLLEYHGPRIGVSIGLDPTWTKDQPRAPRPDKRNIAALIDTGAQYTCIDSKLADEIHLPIIDKQPVGGVGLLIVDVYNGQIHVGLLRYTIHGPIAGIPGLEDRIHVPVVLGRAFLRDCLFTYSGRTGEASIEVVAT